MRLVFSLAILAAASPAAFAQSPPRPNPVRQPELNDRTFAAQLAAQQELAARQAVIQQNELSRLDLQLRTQQNLAALQAMGSAPIVPAPPTTGPPRSIDVSGLASIPDSTLADSNARVRAAAENRP